MANTKANARKTIARHRQVNRDASPVRTPEPPAPTPSGPAPAPVKEVSDVEIDALLARHATSENYEAIAMLVAKCRALDTTVQEIVERLRRTLNAVAVHSTSVDWRPRKFASTTLRRHIHDSLRLLPDFCESSLEGVLKKAEERCVQYGTIELHCRAYFDAMPFPNLYLTKWNGTTPTLDIPILTLRDNSTMSLIAAHHAYIIAHQRSSVDYRC